MNPAQTGAQTGAHPSPEEVDAILDPSGGAPEVAEHVRRCGRCRRTRDSLAEVRALLRQESARVPDPPADLHARIAAALADLPQASGRAPDLAVPVPLRRRRQPSRWLAAAATVAVLAGATSVAVQVGRGGAESTTSAESAADSAGGAAGAGVDAGTAAEPTGSGTDYTSDGLQGQVAALMAAPTAAALAEAPASVAPDAAAESAPLDAAAGSEAARSEAAGAGTTGDRSLADPATLAGCVEALGAVGQVPLAVDLARWEGADAAVLVLADASPRAATGLRVWVVDRRCSRGRPMVLHTERLAS